MIRWNIWQSHSRYRQHQTPTNLFSDFKTTDTSCWCLWHRQHVCIHLFAYLQLCNNIWRASIKFLKRTKRKQSSRVEDYILIKKQFCIPTSSETKSKRSSANMKIYIIYFSSLVVVSSITRTAPSDDWGFSSSVSELCLSMMSSFTLT